MSGATPNPFDEFKTQLEALLAGINNKIDEVGQRLVVIEEQQKQQQANADFMKMFLQSGFKEVMMAELEKMKRTAAKVIPGAPHDVLLVLDATTGQNGLAQAREFTSTVRVMGIILTKLDGTAKGGIVVAISRELGLPVRFVGVGEKAGDLLPFDPKEFVDSLFE